MNERDCPKCGYGIMEIVLRLNIEATMESDDEVTKTAQKQQRIWRCIDCLFEMEVENGNG